MNDDQSKRQARVRMVEIFHESGIISEAYGKTLVRCAMRHGREQVSPFDSAAWSCRCQLLHALGCMDA